MLHFSGHGTTGILVFEDHAGNAVQVSGEALADLISLSPSIKCVVLNSCFSDSIAILVAPHVDAVIGCDVSVGDEAATFFTRALYRALAHGEAIETAFDWRRTNLPFQTEKQRARNTKYI